MNKWTGPFEWNRGSALPVRRRRSAPSQHYFAFLSYSHQDSADADWLHSELEAFRVPASLAGRLTSHGVIPRRLTPIFRDRHELAAADDLGEEISEALAGSRCLIVLCSPAAATSKWTNAEIELFKRLHPEGCVIAAIVAGEPFASDIEGREQEECLPPALRQKYDRRGRPTGRRAEPLAADLREGQGGRRLGMLKIVAGILGIGLDELVQREQLRRHRRLASITAASLGGMLLASVLAVTAIQARDSARDQRREAESLVQFMLGDLKEKLEPIGKLDALDGVGARVLAYYSKQDMSELSDSALLQRSRALSLTAEVAYLRGQVDTAQRLYHEAMDGTREAIRRNPDDPQRLYDHAQNVFWVGEIAHKRGQFDQSEAAYREYKTLADRMVELEPDNLKWRMEVLYANENLGIVLLSQRRFAEAAREFEGALRPMESLASIDSKNTDYRKELANLQGWLADALRDQGRLNAAIAVRQRQLPALERLLAEGNGDVGVRQLLIPAHQALGILYSERGDSKRGIEELRLAVAEAGRLLPVEPDNVVWTGFAASARLQLARALVAERRFAEASDQARLGCALATQMRERNANLARARTLQASCLAVRAEIALKSGATAAALALAEQAVTAAQAQRSGDSVMDRYTLAAAYRLLGDVRRRTGDGAGASGAWAVGLAQLPGNVSERPWEMNERSELLRRLGRADEVRPLAARLTAIGYRSTS